MDNGQVNLYTFSADPTTLAVTSLDAYNFRSAYDNRYGLGLGVNPNNQNHVNLCILDNSGNFYYEEVEINSSTGSIGSVGTTQWQNWSSGYYKPLQDANFFKYSSGGYFAQMSCDSSGEIRVK